jgi:hydroxymethylpyrimidine pyrophosphatase-like HAD family hydrolase
MWKSVNGRLIHTKDESRVKFRTNISKSLIEYLNQLSAEYNTHANYLIETGLQKVLEHGVITFNKELRPKDRIQYKTTYDKELLVNVKEFAKDHDLYINDVIEYSVKFIDFTNIKSASYRHRIE